MIRRFIRAVVLWSLYPCDWRAARRIAALEGQGYRELRQ